MCVCVCVCVCISLIHYVLPVITIMALLQLVYWGTSKSYYGEDPQHISIYIYVCVCMCVCVCVLCVCLSVFLNELVCGDWCEFLFNLVGTLRFVGHDFRVLQGKFI